MTDFSNLTPPPQVVLAAFGRCFVPPDGVAAIARWGAEQAAERLANQWPEPITDRPPTEADGDAEGRVQFLWRNSQWCSCHWRHAARDGDPWRHMPGWQPPAPPTLKELALAACERCCYPTQEDKDLIRRAILGGEA